MRTATNEDATTSPNPGIIPLAADQDNPESPIPAPGPYPWRPTPKTPSTAGGGKPPIQRLNAGLVAQAIAAGSPIKLGILFGTIAGNGPVEAVQYPDAWQALRHLWNALQAPPEGREGHLQAYLRAVRPVTLADYRDVLDELAREVGL